MNFDHYTGINQISIVDIVKATNKEKMILKKLEPKDWEILREIRLKSIEQCPNIFAPSSDESNSPKGYWVERLSNPERSIWSLMDKDEPIGVTGIVVVRGEPESGALVMTFVDKAHQGKGLSKMFYETRIQWAKKRGLKRLYLIHAVGNQKVERAIRNLGFKFKENYCHEHHNGEKQECSKYVLELNI